MTQQKQNIYIPETYLKALKLGYTYAICAFLLLHLINLFRDDWHGRSERFSGSSISIVVDHNMTYWIKDLILDKTHEFSGYTSYDKLERVTFPKFFDCLISVFDGHILQILILGLILSLLTYFFAKYKINVTK